MTRRPAPLFTLLLVCLWALPVVTQDSVSTDAPAHVSAVDGAALLERDGRTDADLLSMPLLAGDRVRTQAGRVEILFTDGSALHLDEQTVVDFQSDEVVRVLEGRIRLSIPPTSRDIGYRLDAPSAWVQIDRPGEYRLSVLRNDEVELAVLRGGAELVNEQGRSYIAAGERTFARAGAAPSPAYVFNSAAWDSFDRWSEARRDQRLGVSAQYLPPDVQRYAPAFDTYGSWRYEQVYGYVWYPRVQVGWRPYHRGRWANLRPYGWTWIAGDPWGWPTHHYGRWGISAGSWFWIPGRSWSPAWVSWAYAPGYVSWCPLGWNDRPVLQFALNIYGGRRYDPWYAWTVLPRQHFGVGDVNVTRYASVRVDPRLHDSFVVGRRGPDVNFAINRSSVPIRTPGRFAGTRGDDNRGPGSYGSRGDAVIGGRDGERRLPPAARTPSSPLNAQQADRGGVRSGAVRSRGDSPAASRDASPPVQYSNAPSAYPQERARAVTRGGSADDSNSESRGYRRNDGAVNGPVTAAPGGAVRAMPRMRGSDATSAPSGPPERTRTYSTAPRYESPSNAAPSYSPPPSRAPQVREAPRAEERGYGRQPSYRGGVERSEPAPAPRSDGPPSRSYGAPERQAPPARSDAPPPGGGGEPRGGARERSGEGRQTGQATGRRR